MRATDLFDNYIFNQLSLEEKRDFENRLKTDPAFAAAFEKHQTLIDTINQHEQRQHLKQILNTIHQQEFGKEGKILSIKKESFIQKHGKMFAVAASVTIIAVMSTITVLSAGGYLLKQQGNAITDLKRDVTELKYSQDALIKGITNANNQRFKKQYAPANIEGTGFALNNKGYFITSYHMVKNSDSVFVTNNVLERASVKLVASEPSLDIAIYKIENYDAIKNISFPFCFKEKYSDIGDKIFTLGYSRRDIVYGEGSLSSMTGFNNDTTMYQISIPVNPGNSGGPLMDEQGNVIGVIRGKQSSAEATGFAIKSNFIKQTIENLKNDTLQKELLLSTKKSNLKGLKRSEQIKKIQPFVFNVMVYKK